ncbi:uncharacterized protein [Drosophila virilis]|nr:testis-specific Y-encoded-like protein 2 [Drosophila virilis]
MPERSISQRDLDEIEIDSDEEDEELEQGIGLPVQSIRRRAAVSPDDNARRRMGATGHGGRGSSSNISHTNGPQSRERSRERFSSSNAAQESEFYDDDDVDDDGRRVGDNAGSDDEDDIEMVDYDT